MDDKNVKGIVLVLGASILALLYIGFDSGFAPYVIIAALLLLIVSAKRDAIEERIEPSKKNVQRPGEDSMENREKKLLMYYLLELLDHKKTIDMKEIATDLDISIYTLTDILKFMSKHDIIKVIYPPMRSFPVIRVDDKEKSEAFREKLFLALAKKDLLGNPVKEEFNKEVKEYVEGMKRKRDIQS
ncbi:MAG: hypothetical protein GF416_00340 [Candidatus Altiarchaeales archaeon]|nr:hypothetical protein [Candidatus Altiarchaeales archaeon]MBD3415568.1 hypothetical protein [Candidatus Altiarchaeales archaeon]